MWQCVCVPLCNLCTHHVMCAYHCVMCVCLYVIIARHHPCFYPHTSPGFGTVVPTPYIQNILHTFAVQLHICEPRPLSAVQLENVSK